jgi:NhaP-type Na+/H+ or K+/H+ antiporter
MWQALVKLVQAAIFFAVVIGMMNSDHPDAPKGLALAAVAVLVVFVVTVIPWLILMMFKQLSEDIRKRRSKAARVDVVLPELLNDPVPGRWISGDSRARIGK